MHGPVHDRGGGGHGAIAKQGSVGPSVHEQQYRQQQLQRQHQQKVRQQQRQAGESKQHITQDAAAGGAKWSWKAGAGWQPYDRETSEALEQCHERFFACKLDGSDPGPYVKVEVGGGRHVNLTTMQQVVTATPGRTRHVRRRGPAPRACGGEGGKPVVHSRDTWI